MEGLKEYLLQLNDEFECAMGGDYYKLDTGEVFTESEVKLYISKKIEEFNLKRQAETNLLLINSGLEPTQRIINRRSSKKKKNKDRFDGGDFNMIYRGGVNNKMAMKLTLVEEGIFSRLCNFLHYPTNSVMINDEVAPIEVLMNIMDLKERALRGHLKTLENKGLIKMIQFGHKKCIYVNPKYCASGKDLDLDTLNMFGIVDLNINKVEEYL